MSSFRVKLGILAAGLMASAPAAVLAQGLHGEEPHTSSLSLNQGEKWATDAPLRQGMTGIRTALAEVSEEIDAGSLASEGYEELATSVEGQVDYMIENCELPADADAQLHILLEQILEGVGQMRGSDDPQEGAVEVAEALEGYGTHFDHEGWKPLPH